MRARRWPGEVYGVPLASRGRLASLGSVPILACVGYNGMGKSALAARLAMDHADAGRTVLGTARLLDWRNPRPCPDNGVCDWPSHGEPGHMAAHPMWRPLLDYRQLFTARDAHLWLDEATGVADARGSASMPSEVADFIPRLRAKQVTVCWTTIHWSFADVRLRRVTWAAAWAVGLMPRYHGDEIWGRNRLFYFRAYDAKNLPDDFDLAKRNSKGQTENLRAMVRGWVWGPRWDAFGAYDTLDGVSSLGGTDGSGMCLTCGGHRGRRTCKGHDEAGTSRAALSSTRAASPMPSTPVVAGSVVIQHGASGDVPQDATDASPTATARAAAAVGPSRVLRVPATAPAARVTAPAPPMTREGSTSGPRDVTRADAVCRDDGGARPVRVPVLPLAHEVPEPDKPRRGHGPRESVPSLRDDQHLSSTRPSR